MTENHFSLPQEDDQYGGTHEEHPEERHHNFFFDRILHMWMNPLVHMAYKEPLEERCVWSTDGTEMCVERHSAMLSHAWKEECKKARADQRSPTLSRAIFRVYCKDFMWGGLFHFCFLVLQLTQPYIIGKLLSYISSDSGDAGIQDGVAWALVLGVVAFLSSNSFILAFTNNRRFGTFVKAALMMNIYEHSLKITNSARLKNDVGKTTNLMAIDAEKIFLAVQFLHFLWHSPLTILAVMGILVSEIGAVPALFGLFTVSMTIPAQRRVALIIGKMRQKMIALTDSRVSLISEILQIIRAAKLYAWEDLIYDRVAAIRALEVKKMRNYVASSAFLRDVNQISPVLTSFSIFMALIFIVYRSSLEANSEELTTAKAVKVLAFLGILRFPLNLMGVALKTIVDGRVSLSRLRDFFMLETLKDRERPKGNSHGSDVFAICFNNATFSWSPDYHYEDSNTDDTNADNVAERDTVDALSLQCSDEKLLASSSSLTNINFSIQEGELIGLIGPVGSGKSNLISAILGEMPCVRGQCQVIGDIAYSAQTPWIQNMSVKDNILFGADLSSSPELGELYSSCLYQAALTEDLSNLPHGDLTEIGERGINLSGGQKSRVSFCRALFASRDRDIVILDDPFSSVDGQTGNWMFSHGVEEGLRGKIRILALNSHLHLLKNFDRIIVMDSGNVALIATPSELFSTHRQVYERILGSLHQAENDQNISVNEASTETEIQVGTDAPHEGEERIRRISQDDSELSTREHRLSISTQQSGIEMMDINVGDDKRDAVEAGRLVAAESRATHSVSIYTYFCYFGAAFWNDATTPKQAKRLSLASTMACLSVLLAYGMTQFIRVYCDIALLQWVGTGHAEEDSKYFKIYLAIVGAFLLFTTARSCFLSFYATLICKRVHNLLFRKILNAPIPDFFDITMVGNILNRFAKDMEVTDVTIPEYINMFLYQFFSLITVVALCIWSVPLFIFFVIPIVVLVLYFFLHFAPFSQDIKRLEGISRTPVYSSFSETLTGLETIRAYGATRRFQNEHSVRMSRNHKLFYHLTMGQNWLTARMELSGVYFLVSISIVAVVVKEFTVVSEAKLGLAMVYTLQLTAMFQRCVQLALELQTYFTSVERIVHFIDVPQESPTVCITEAAKSTNTSSMSAVCKQRELPLDWPNAGSIAFHDVWMKYRNNTPYVLKGVSFSIKQGERVGVCGRTGAGKSSIIQVLFRIVETSSGYVEIAGFDTRQVPLKRLRSVLAIIPQDPVLMRGTLRYQLDPFDMYSDDEIWRVLKKVNMDSAVESLADGLAEPISEGGENLSQGEKQLLCIARALLRNAKVLVLDEATSACDPVTDDLIQKVLKSECVTNGTTVMTIAHRLHTIIDFDRILVLGAGEVIEFDAPATLLADGGSEFSKMLDDYNASHKV